MKENVFTLKEKKIGSRRFSAEIITGSDCADDLVHLKNRPAQTESLLHSLEQAARGISRNLNLNKTDFICLLKGKFLKFVDQFMYLGSNILSTESDVNMRIG